MNIPRVGNFNSVIQYYKNFIHSDSFHLTYTTETYFEKILKSTDVCKAVGVDELLGCFLRDGSRVSSKPISELCNFSIKLGSFLNSCKTAKLKPLFRKRSKTNP